MQPLAHHAVRMRGLRTAPPQQPQSPAFDEEEARRQKATLRRAAELAGQNNLNAIRSSYERAKSTGDFSEYNRLRANRQGFAADESGRVMLDENGTPVASDIGRMRNQYHDLNRALRPELTQEKLDRDRAGLARKLQITRGLSAENERRRAAEFGDRAGSIEADYGSEMLGYRVGPQTAQGIRGTHGELLGGVYRGADADRKAQVHGGVDQAAFFREREAEARRAVYSLENDARALFFPESKIDVDQSNARRAAARRRAAEAQKQRGIRRDLDRDQLDTHRHIEGAGYAAGRNTADAGVLDTERGLSEAATAARDAKITDEARLRTAGARRREIMATQRGATAQAETGLTNSQIEQGAAEGRLGRQPTEQAIEDARVQRARVEAERARDRQGTAEDIADARLEHEYDSLDDEFAIKDAQAEAARLQAEGIIATHRAGGPIIQDPSGFRQAAGAALMEIAAPIDAGDTGQATYDQIPTKQINYFVNVHMASLREAYQSGDAQQKRIAIETARELMSLAPETEPDGDIRLRRTFWGFVRDAVLPYGGEKRRDEAGYYNPERSGMARSREATQMLISAMDELEAIAAGEPLTQP